MGRNSSGTRGGLQPGDATYKGSIGKPEPLVNMKGQGNTCYGKGA